MTTYKLVYCVQIQWQHNMESHN